MTFPDQQVYCCCQEPYLQHWKDGTVFCTRCGWRTKTVTIEHPDDLCTCGRARDRHVSGHGCGRFELLKFAHSAGEKHGE
jgi:hypothetical protein